MTDQLMVDASPDTEPDAATGRSDGVDGAANTIDDLPGGALAAIEAILMVADARSEEPRLNSSHWE